MIYYKRKRRRRRRRITTGNSRHCARTDRQLESDTNRFIVVVSFPWRG
jgi:hypothetical protein